MADPDPVDIVVKITNKYSKQIENLKAELKSIQNSVDVGLDLDDNGDIDLAKMSLEQIDNLISVLIRVDDSALDAAALKLEAIKARSDPKAAIRDVNGDMGFGSERTGWMRGLEDRINPGGDRDRGGGLSRMLSGDGLDFGGGVPTFLGGRGRSRKGRGFARAASGIMGTVSNITDRFDGMGKNLKKAFPSMRKWMNLIAALIPMMITLGVQALGVAAAMGSVAVAGAGMLGMGLFGRGEGLEESMKNAQERLKDFKKDLFSTFEGTFSSFSPITSAFLGMAPDQLSGVAESLQGLREFKGTFFEGFKGATNWVEEFIDTMVDLEPIMSQLTMRFGEMTGNKIIDFFRWLTQEAYQNQDVMVDLGSVFMDILEIIYNVSKFVSVLIADFRFVFDAVAGLTKLLENDFLRTLGRVLAVAGALVGVLYAIETAATLAAMAMTKTGLGAVLVAGGIVASQMMLDPPKGPPSTGGGTGGGDKYVFNYDGSGTYRDMNRFRRTAEGVVKRDKTDSNWRSRS